MQVQFKDGAGEQNLESLVYIPNVIRSFGKVGA